MRFFDFWKSTPFQLPSFEKAKLSRDELTKAREIIRELQEKNRPAYDIVSTIQRTLKINQYRAQRVFDTEVKRNDVVATRSLGRDIGFTKYKVILSPNACPLCIEKSNNGRKVFSDADVHKTGYGQFVPWHPNCYCITVPVE